MLKLCQNGYFNFSIILWAQIFDAIGLSDKIIKKYFTGTSNKVEGITLDEIERELRKGTLLRMI